ncbi:MAG: type I-C CRISPR-associated protein Cas7/Csd2 [Deltaproteobacteria bacterium]|nr:type I-C CRISPR-associated protein Cas7/Csd2 [Deltaproteobacteria bacterium]
MKNAIQNRYDFVLLFDVQDGNPNGDPDAGNLPRTDPETGNGLVTDVCLKRKVRNYVGVVKNEQPPFEIYIKEKAILNQQNERAYKALNVDVKAMEGKRKGGDKTEEAKKWMCQNFFDVRTFGAVMSTGINCGQVRGPVQITFSRSIDQVIPSEHSITRMAVATEAEAEKQQGDNRTMGRKFTIPYGLYRCHGFISAHLAAQTGFSDEDLGLFWEALKNMFEHDRSAARGQMTTQGLYVFKHPNTLGQAPAHVLFDRIKVQSREPNKPMRCFADYQIHVDESNLPGGVELMKLVG